MAGRYSGRRDDIDADGGSIGGVRRARERQDGKRRMRSEQVAFSNWVTHHINFNFNFIRTINFVHVKTDKSTSPNKFHLISRITRVHLTSPPHLTSPRRTRAPLFPSCLCACMHCTCTYAMNDLETCRLLFGLSCMPVSAAPHPHYSVRASALRHTRATVAHTYMYIEVAYAPSCTRD